MKKIIYGIFEDCDVLGTNEERNDNYDLLPHLIVNFGLYQDEEKARIFVEVQNEKAYQFAVNTHGEKSQQAENARATYHIREIKIND
jgi:hypothetical protein